MSKSAYDANSIKTLNPRESIRENLGMYIGSNNLTGLHQLFIEGIANSIDEAVAGYGNEINVIVSTAKNELTIIDNGRGIPFGINDEGKDALIEATCNLHGGGKFIGQDGYKSSLGLHGLGLKCIHYLSSSFTIKSVRDNQMCSLSFDKNDRMTKIGPVASVEKRGTTITFIPDDRIFNDLKWDPTTIAAKMQTFALLNNNIKFILNVDGVKQEFFYTDGIKDLLKIKIGDANLITTPVFQKCDITNDNGDHAYFEFGFAYTDKSAENEYCYANGGETPNGGTYLTGFKSAYTLLINKYAKDAGIDKKFTGDMVRRGLIMVMIMRADFRLQYAEQTKLTLNSPEARGLASKAVGQFDIDSKVIKQILNKITIEQKAEEAAQRKREAQEKIARGGKSMNSLKDLPEKLADASDFTDAEIFFVEGDSAAGGAREAKSANQAILPLKGKVKNCTALELDEVIKSDTIKDILTCLGCGIGDHFNINNLRYNRIIIMTDSDPDGGHIEILLLTLFLHHLPELVRQGKVYTAVSPLYKTITAKEKRYWLPSELSEYKKYVRNHKNVEVVRLKGLGELNADELYSTTMDPEHRSLIQLTTDNIEETLKLYDVLMGKQPSLRKDFIIRNKLSKYSQTEDDNIDNFDDEE